MSKPAKKNNTLYIALGVTVVVALWLNMSGDAPKSAVKRIPSKAVTKQASTLGAKSEVAILDEDLTANFPPVTGKLKTSFKPLVQRNVTDLVNGPTNQIPSLFADGESWIYTGSATVDGRRQGLIENAATGEGVFLSAGQKWRKLVCNEIRDDGIIVTGPDGDVRTISLLTEPKETENIAPLNPSGLSGSIEPLPDASGRRGRRGRNNNGGEDGSAPAAAGGMQIAPGGDAPMILTMPGQ